MASGVRALGSDREPQEWLRATEEARTKRSIVAGQLADLLVGAELTGGDQLVAQRMRQYAEARRHGDVVVMRAEALNTAVAWGVLVVRFDLRQDFPR